MRFDTVGVDVGRIQILHGVRMFAMRGLVFGAFAPGLARLCPFVLQAHFRTLGQHPWRASASAFVQDFGAQVEERVAVANEVARERAEERRAAIRGPVFL